MEYRGRKGGGERDEGGGQEKGEAEEVDGGEGQRGGEPPTPWGVGVDPPRDLRWPPPRPRPRPRLT